MSLLDTILDQQSAQLNKVKERNIYIILIICRDDAYIAICNTVCKTFKKGNERALKILEKGFSRLAFVSFSLYCWLRQDTIQLL